MRRKLKAPSVIAGLYVLAFAHADKSVRFEQRHTLNVDGKWLGRVPCLALCTPFNERAFVIQHCTESWEPLGVAAGYKTVKEAKERIERSYHGIGAKWQRQELSKRKALALYEAELRKDNCSFCGRTPLEFTAAVGDTVRICNHCVDSFHEAIHS